MFCCAHDHGLALLLAEDQGQPDETPAPPVVLRIIMIGILAVNAAALGIIALARDGLIPLHPTPKNKKPRASRAFSSSSTGVWWSRGGSNS